MNIKKIAIIGSDFINALSIYKSLKEHDFKGDIYSLSSKKYKLLSTIYKNDVVSIKIDNENDLISFLLGLDGSSKKYLFLTNEVYHPILFKNKQILFERNVVFYFGSLNPSEIIDKDKFATIFANDEIAQTPRSYNVNDTIKQEVVVKFKSSFINGKKTLPVRIIRNNEEFEKYLVFIEKQGFNKNNIIVQEKLSTNCKDNISIVGWHDNDEQLYFQTRKLIQHPKEGGTGDLVEMTALDESFKFRTKHILNKINYNGPFEIEFIKSLNGDEEYKLLEINPRFWMQNGLVNVNSGNSLINLFLSIKNNGDGKNIKYWINLPHYLKSLFYFDKESWYYLPKILFKTHSPVSFKDLFIYLIRK